MLPDVFELQHPYCNIGKIKVPQKVTGRMMSDLWKAPAWCQAQSRYSVPLTPVVPKFSPKLCLPDVMIS